MHEKSKVFDVDEYFRSLNPIAKRIADDVRCTRENYESAWHYLNPEEQNQVINESIVFPDAVLKYSLDCDIGCSGPGSFPVLKQEYGMRLARDDSGLEWRDEHSSPFCWRTRSQMDVRVLAPQMKASSPAAKKPFPPFPKPDPVFKEYERPAEREPSPEKPSVLEHVHSLQSFPDFPSGDTSEDTVDGEVVMRSKRDDASDQDFSPSSREVITRSGFEFLDNW